MYYKAILYLTPKINFEVKEISNEDAQTLCSGIYGFYKDKKSGVFAIRKTKKTAINVLKKGLYKRIDKLKSDINRFNSTISIMEDYEQRRDI